MCWECGDFCDQGSPYECGICGSLGHDTDDCDLEPEY